MTEREKWVYVTKVRHAATDWNAQRRIQGRSDIPLNEHGQAQADSWSLEAAGHRWFASPLGRTVETARILGAASLCVEPRIVEMHWGDWEGRTINNLREELGEAMVRNEAHGLDFRPIGGESPREVQTRLAAWLFDLSRQQLPCVAVSHKGVIRALLSLATGWDMKGKAPYRLDWNSAHQFRVRAHSSDVYLHQLNICMR